MYFIRIKQIIIFVLMAISVIANAEESEVNKVRAAIERFCKSEFDGIEDTRMQHDLVAFSKEGNRREKMRDSQFEGMVNFLDSDPLCVVTSYKVSSIDIRNNDAIAIVIYKTLAKSEGDGFDNRQLVRYNIEDKVIFKLSHRNEKWRVLDPSLPRVSKAAMIRWYQDSIYTLEEIINNPTTSEAQKRAYQKEMETLKFIKSL